MFGYSRKMLIWWNTTWQLLRYTLKITAAAELCLVVCFLWFVLCLCVYFCDLYWVFSLLFVSNSQVIGCEDHLQNDLYCVRWGVKLFSVNQSVYKKSNVISLSSQHMLLCSIMQSIVSNIKENDVVSPLRLLLNERAKQRDCGKTRFHSIYRDILFLSFAALGRDCIDHGLHLLLKFGL